MIKYWLIGVLLTFAMWQCGSPEEKEVKVVENPGAFDSIKVEQEVVEEEILPTLDSFFRAIDTNFTTQEIIVPKGFDVQILFTEKLDKVVNHLGEVAPAKNDHDMIAYLPIEGANDHGWLYVGHETRYADPVLGDGGGGTMFEIQIVDGQWEVVSDFQNIDFSSVRGTNNNCGGAVAPNGKIYTCEESVPQNNNALYIKGRGHQDTSLVNGVKFHQHFGYIVEVDPVTKKATQKLYGMGRYYHEDLEFMDDRKTVYLSDDYEPCVLYKFVAEQEDDYSKGQLFAFQEGIDKNGWIKMPMDTASLIDCRNVAISKGATLMMRHEWFARVGNKLYIAETGHDSTNWTNRLDQGGHLANHLERDHSHGNGILTDYYGRILVLDTKTDELKVLLEGGVSKDAKTVFSNPDCISTVNLGGRDYLVIQEDINGNGYGRVPQHAFKKNKWYNELYFLDLSIENPTVEDLKRFAITPMGAEFTGGIFTPDGKTMFLNIQHPFARNKAPYNKSMTVAITGW